MQLDVQIIQTVIGVAQIRRCAMGMTRSRKVT